MENQKSNLDRVTSPGPVQPQSPLQPEIKNAGGFMIYVRYILAVVGFSIPFITLFLKAPVFYLNPLGTVLSMFFCLAPTSISSLSLWISALLGAGILFLVGHILYKFNRWFVWLIMVVLWFIGLIAIQFAFAIVMTLGYCPVGGSDDSKSSSNTDSVVAGDYDIPEKIYFDDCIALGKEVLKDKGELRVKEIYLEESRSRKSATDYGRICSVNLCAKVGDKEEMYQVVMSNVNVKTYTLDNDGPMISPDLECAYDSLESNPKFLSRTEIIEKAKNDEDFLNYLNSSVWILQGNGEEAAILGNSIEYDFGFKSYVFKLTIDAVKGEEDKDFKNKAEFIFDAINGSLLKKDFIKGEQAEI